MKKLSISLLLIFVAFANLTAQNISTFPCPGCDTIDNLSERYYRTEWYDTCYYFRHPEARYPGGEEEYYQTERRWTKFWSTLLCPYDAGGKMYVTKWNRFPGKLAVKGLAALVMNRNCGGHPYLRHEYLPEYMLLWNGGPNDMPGTFVDSVRWDTAQPLVMRFNMTPYNDTFDYCFVYEAYFKEPYLMDSTFWISGTQNSKTYEPGTYIQNPTYAYIPTTYASPRIYGPWDRTLIQQPNAQYYECTGHRMWKYEDSWGGDVGWVWINTWMGAFGYYLPIVGYYWDLNVQSDSTDLGTVEGGGRLPDMSYDTIRALPSFGYEFVEWNDGNTENPRIVYLTSDTTFTARFREMKSFEIQMGVNNPLWGSVEGQGRYPQDYTLMVSAVPNVKKAYFVGWDDGDTNNPRYITMTQDTSITAIFAFDSTAVGIEASPEHGLEMRISPNPVRNMLKIKTDRDVRGVLSIYDSKGVKIISFLMEGRETRIDVSNLPEGQYLLILTENEKRAHAKFVKR